MAADTNPTSLSGPSRSLRDRIVDAHRSRALEAEEEYANNMLEKDLAGLGIFGHTLQRFTPGVEPTWLIRAKRLHDDLGKYIYALSRRSTMNLPDEVVAEAEREVRAFVSRMPGQAEHQRLDAAMFLGTVNAVSKKDDAFAEPLRNQPPEEVVCFAYSLHDLDIALKLADHIDDVALLLRRWPDRTPWTPTRWAVAADLWTKVSGQGLSPETLRRYDPEKKQVLPGSRAPKTKGAKTRGRSG